MVLGVLGAGITVLGLGVGLIAAPYGWALGAPVAGFFGACTAVIFWRAFTNEPVLSLTQEGVLSWRYPPLAWDEIDFSEAAESSGELFLVIHAKDHDGYLRRFGFFKRQWARMSAKLMQGSVYLSRQMFEVPVADVAKAINAELARRRSGHR